MSENNTTQEEQPPSFFERLIRKHVIQSVAIYIAVAWGALEILITLQERLGWPPMISTWATRLFVAGFPIAAIFAWRRDIESRSARTGLVSLAFLTAGVALWLTLSSEGTGRLDNVPTETVNPPIATVAVLPFVNANGDESMEYLASGFTGELIGRLSKHPDLAIIQEESLRSPALLDLIPIAKASRLRADYLVEGKVLREGQSIEVTARLQNLDGQVLWSDILRDKLSASRVSAMQRRISGEISRVLGVQLDAPAYCGETSDLEAMELYYQGRHLISKRNLEDALAGIELLKEAVDRDPYYGRAWNQLGSGNLYASAEVRQTDRARADVMVRMAGSAFRRALDICPTIGYAFLVLVPEYEDAENEIIDKELQYRDALALDPNDADLLRQYFFHLANSGMVQESIKVMQRAYRVEPLLAMIPAQLAQALTIDGRCDEAITLSQESEALGGQLSAVIKYICTKEAGDIDGHLQASEIIIENGMPDWFRVLGMPGREVIEAMYDPTHPLRPAIVKRLREVWEENPVFSETDHEYWLIDMATNFGDYDLVFDMLETIAWEGGFRGFNPAWSPLFASWESSRQLRSQPRFVELMNMTGLPEYWRKYGWPNGCAPDGDSFHCF